MTALAFPAKWEGFGFTAHEEVLRYTGGKFLQATRDEVVHHEPEHRLGIRPDPIDMLMAFSNHQSGHMMGDHLGSRGYRRIGYSGHTQERGAERIEGLKEGLALHGAELVKVVPMAPSGSISVWR